jgi:hypothetical protein
LPPCNTQYVLGDLQDPESRVRRTIAHLRKRKGMKEAVPDVGDYMDKVRACVRWALCTAAAHARVVASQLT